MSWLASEVKTDGCIKERKRIAYVVVYGEVRHNDEPKQACMDG